jgi:hypothetical protein
VEELIVSLKEERQARDFLNYWDYLSEMFFVY